MVEVTKKDVLDYLETFKCGNTILRAQDERSGFIKVTLIEGKSACEMTYKDDDIRYHHYSIDMTVINTVHNWKRYVNGLLANLMFNLMEETVLEKFSIEGEKPYTKGGMRPIRWR